MEDGQFWNRAPLPDETAKKIAEAISAIRRRYDAGEPLYTKEMLREVCQQLQKVDENGLQAIWIRGIDGNPAKFDVFEIGSVKPHKLEATQLELVVTKPAIFYRSIEMLTSSIFNYDPRIAFCSLRIVHQMSLRNKVTKVLIPPCPPTSLEDTGKLFKAIQYSWRKSEACQTLRSTLSLAKLPSGSTNKVVGFALGTLRRVGTNSTGLEKVLSQRSAYQHALVLTLQNILQQMNDNADVSIACYTQDPNYSAVDKSVLERDGIAVLRDPQAFLEVDDSMIVVSCSPDAPIKSVIADIARPAVMIWDSIPNVEPERSYNEDVSNETIMQSDPNTPRVRDMVRNSYDEFEFPGDAQHFGKLAIYIRRPSMLNPSP